MDFFTSVFETYPWLGRLIVFAACVVAWFLINKVISALLEKLSEETQIKYKLVRNTALGLAIPFVGIWIWTGVSGNPWHEYLLITDSQIANGFITSVEEDSEPVEQNDRYVGTRYYYIFEYNFTLPNGRTIESIGSEEGELPSHLTNVQNKPYPIEVEYLAENADVNRVKGLPNAHTSVYEWLRYTMLMGLIVFLFCSYLSFSVIKDARKKFVERQKDLKRLNELVAKQ